LVAAAAALDVIEVLLNRCSTTSETDDTLASAVVLLDI
jgi:hypothetical protein